jgi:AraC-like DNA-binding protein
MFASYRRRTNADPAPWPGEVSGTSRLSPVADLEAMAAAHRGGVDVEYVQLESGPFAGWWSVIPLGILDIQIGGADVSLVRRILMPPERWLLVVPLAMPTPARWNGSSIVGGEIITVPPGSRTYAFDPAGSRYALVTLDRLAVAEINEDVLAMGPSSGAVVIRPKLLDSRALRRELARVGDLYGAGSISRGAEHDLRDALMARLADCLKPAAVLPSRKSTMSTAIVARSEDFAHRHTGEPVTIAQLSAASGVSERSLRNAFYEVCAVGPKRYLRIRSLHHVRRALTRTGTGRSSVTDVATFHGFFELGRFAGEYKALFGEAPSETLQKTKARMTALIPADAVVSFQTEG